MKRTIEADVKVIYENVYHNREKNTYIIQDGKNEKHITGEYVDSMGWEYDGNESELYTYSEKPFCCGCESFMMYDTQQQEFYCPMCNNE